LLRLSPGRTIQPAILAIQPSISTIPCIILNQSLNPCYPSTRLAGSTLHFMCATIGRLPRPGRGIPCASPGRPRPAVLPRTSAARAFTPVACPAGTLRLVSFQSLTTIKFSKPLVLIAIRNAGGVRTPVRNLTGQAPYLQARPAHPIRSKMVAYLFSAKRGEGLRFFQIWLLPVK
jgi:hypothetical protein